MGGSTFSSTTKPSAAKFDKKITDKVDRNLGEGNSKSIIEAQGKASQAARYSPGTRPIRTNWSQSGGTGTGQGGSVGSGGYNTGSGGWVAWGEEEGETETGLWE